MIPRKREFEQVKVDEWLTGEIVDILYEENREFVFKGQKSNQDAVRLIITLDGYKDKHPTNWLKFNYSEKSNLFKNFILPLVEGAYQNMPFDLDNLKNTRIKIMYGQNGEYQNIVMVRPLNGKLLPGTEGPKKRADAPVKNADSKDDDKVPF
jgi:hypothetical protein